MRNLKNEIRSVEGRKKSQENLIEQIEYQKKRELTEVLTNYLIRNRLTEAPGIGGVLRDRIVANKKINNLNDLDKTTNYVFGIGEVKQEAISKWTRRMRKDFASLLEGSFPRKSTVINKYKRKKDEAKRKLSKTITTLADLNKLRLKILSYQVKLLPINRKHFSKMIIGDKQASETVNKYNQGIIQEFDLIPKWLNSFIQTYAQKYSESLTKGQYRGFNNEKEWLKAKKLGFSNLVESEMVTKLGFKNKNDYLMALNNNIKKGKDYYKI